MADNRAPWTVLVVELKLLLHREVLSRPQMLQVEHRRPVNDISLLTNVAIRKITVALNFPVVVLVTVTIIAIP